MGGGAGALADGATHVGHELLADRADVLGEGGRKHHHLLVVWRHFEDGLNVSPHVCSSTAYLSKLTTVVTLKDVEQINNSNVPQLG